MSASSTGLSDFYFTFVRVAGGRGGKGRNSLRGDRARIRFINITLVEEKYQVGQTGIAVRLRSHHSQ